MLTFKILYLIKYKKFVTLLHLHHRLHRFNFLMSRYSLLNLIWNLACTKGLASSCDQSNCNLLYFYRLLQSWNEVKCQLVSLYCERDQIFNHLLGMLLEFQYNHLHLNELRGYLNLKSQKSGRTNFRPLFLCSKINFVL